MTANASASEAGLPVSAAPATLKAAVQAAAEKTARTHARMATLPSAKTGFPRYKASTLGLSRPFFESDTASMISHGFAAAARSACITSSIQFRVVAK
jgi:hypothetical protein